MLAINFDWLWQDALEFPIISYGFRNQTLPLIRAFIHLCGHVRPAQSHKGHLFTDEIDEMKQPNVALLEPDPLVNVCLSCWYETTIISLGAKITELDLRPVIICCQRFLSMKRNNSMISDNLCSLFYIKYLCNAVLLHIQRSFLTLQIREAMLLMSILRLNNDEIHECWCGSVLLVVKERYFLFSETENSKNFLCFWGINSWIYVSTFTES